MGCVSASFNVFRCISPSFGVFAVFRCLSPSFGCLYGPVFSNFVISGLIWDETNDYGTFLHGPYLSYTDQSSAWSQVSLTFSTHNNFTKRKHKHQYRIYIAIATYTTSVYIGLCQPRLSCSTRCVYSHVDVEVDVDGVYERRPKPAAVFTLITYNCKFATFQKDSQWCKFFFENVN